MKNRLHALIYLFIAPTRNLFVKICRRDIKNNRIVLASREYEVKDCGKDTHRCFLIGVSLFRRNLFIRKYTLSKINLAYFSILAILNNTNGFGLEAASKCRL